MGVTGCSIHMGYLNRFGNTIQREDDDLEDQ